VGTRAFFIVSVLLGAGGLVSTFSRGGFLAAGVAVAGLVVLLAARGLIGRRAARLVFVGCALGAIVAAPVLARYLGSRPDYLTMRWDHLRYGLEALRDHALTGVGINNFNVAFAPYDYAGVFREMAVHDHYLRIGVETGVIGLTLYFSFFFGVARAAFRGSRRADPWLATVSTALLAAFIAVFFYWLDDLFYSVAFNTQLWVLAALPYVIAQLPPADAPATAPPPLPAT
jgi:O-antigen ligase